MRYLLVVVIALAGCTVSATPHIAGGFKYNHCKDFRDSEEFTVEQSGLHSATVGFAGAASCALITDMQGREREMCSDQASYIKCRQDNTP